MLSWNKQGNVRKQWVKMMDVSSTSQSLKEINTGAATAC